MSDLAEVLIAEEEGRERCAYLDSLGYQTIAIGCLVDKRMLGAGLCDEAIDAQFEHDSARARSLAAQFPHYADLNDVQEAVLVSMCFQMGDKPLHWPNFVAALGRKDYPGAAAAGMDSDWARTETPKRAKREMQMLASSQWVNQT